jgi:adenylate cyclase class IV
MQNVEFKAELRDPALARTICHSLNSGDRSGGAGAEYIGSLVQTDTYFRVPEAKLKKREMPGAPSEYIFYNRPSRSRPKLSSYTIYTEAQALERFGTNPLPVWVVVKKTRELYMHKGVRIHLDHVEHLGDFLEFEAVVTPDRNLAVCHALMDELRTAFLPAMGEPIACGYAELLAADEGKSR